MSAEQAMVFVRERGKAMAAAAAVTETGMTAVLGGDADEVLAAIDKHSMTAANINGAGQVVAAGRIDDLARFQDERPEGARLRPLSGCRRVPHPLHGTCCNHACRIRPGDLDARRSHPVAVERRRWRCAERS